MNLPQQNPFSASSVEYWTELTPEPASLALFLAIACVATATGTLLLLSSGLDSGWLAILISLWLLVCGRNVWRHVHNRLQITRVRVFAGGAVRMALARGGWLQGRLQPGTLALPSIAWLRLCTDQRRSVDLLLLECRQNAVHWRRFQVIYRHTGSHS